MDVNLSTFVRDFPLAIVAVDAKGPVASNAAIWRSIPAGYRPLSQAAFLTLAIN